MQCLGANSPEPRRRARCTNDTPARRRPAAIQPHVSDFSGSSWILVQAKRACAVQLAQPPPPPPFFSPIPDPRSLKLRVSFPCICSPPLCIIRSVTPLSLATTTWTPEHPFFSTHCYPNTSSDIPCVLGGGSFPVTAHSFSSRGVAAVRARRLFPSTISGVRGSVPVLPLGRKLDWQPVLSRAPKEPHLAV